MKKVKNGVASRRGVVILCKFYGLLSASCVVSYLCLLFAWDPTT